VTLDNPKEPTFYFIFRDLLHSVHLDVSYFAAGIVAHLASDGADTWTVPAISRQDMLQELVKWFILIQTSFAELVVFRATSFSSGRLPRAKWSPTAPSNRSSPC